MPTLIELLDYNLIGFHPLITNHAQNSIVAHIIVNKDDWTLGFCSEFKSEFKLQTTRKQRRKCCYCRVTLNVDGSGNAIEHITSRKKKPYWMFVNHNLAVACDNCNSSKSDDNILINHEHTYGNNPINCPNNSLEYNIFNPHFDKWSDHFEIEDNLFLKAKPNTKGPATYSKCNMKRYHIIIDYLYQLNIRGPISYRILNKRIRIEKDQVKLAQLKMALNYIEDMIDNS